MATPEARKSRTTVTIEGGDFIVNGRPTHAGRKWKGLSVEGLLLNSRMVQGIFDDMNPATRQRFAYPDTGDWDPERNTSEFVSAMPLWQAHGLNAFTLNLQGGSPTGYGNEGWVNSALNPDGSLNDCYFKRLMRILEEADRLGMVVILGLFYFGQDQHLSDEKAIRKAVIESVQWLQERNFRNVLIEINNECEGNYSHAVLKEDRVHELIELVKSCGDRGPPLYAGTSYGGGLLPGEKVVKVSDFILLHGNDVEEPGKITEMVCGVREMNNYTGQPIVFNEDDHYAFEEPTNNFLAALECHASWCFFDHRRKGEPFNEGYQSVPVHWSIRSARKREFFKLLASVTGSRHPQD